jgi:hypothetical protein
MSVNPRDKIRRNLVQNPLELADFLDLPGQVGAASGFCQAIQLEVAGTCDESTWEGKDWKDFPWVTFVLGSGPVGLPDPFWTVAPRLPQLVNTTLERCIHDEEPLFNSFRESPNLTVRDFLRSLIRDRVGDVGKHDASASTTEIGEFAAALVLLAAQLTRVFHSLSLQSSRPVSPSWGTVMAELPTRSAATDLKDEVESLRVTLDFTTERLRSATWPPGQEFTDAVARLLKEVKKNLANVQIYRVNLDHLREVTDLAWQCLVWETCGSSYPGWTELMLNLVLLQNSPHAPTERRPRWRALKELSAQIEGIIRPAAERAWEQWMTPPTPPRKRSAATARHGSDATREFYNAAATLLWRQAIAARSQSHGRRAAAEVADHQRLHMTAASLPKAVAFVTSFDIELEMALLRTRPEGERFISVVVPVYLVKRPRAGEGEFLWLEGVVELSPKTHSGKEVLDCLTNPVRWRVMHQGRYELPEHPIIVRLTGSPLVQLPGPTMVPPPAPGLDDDEDDLASDLRVVGVPQGTNVTFVHSATVDEYLALRQAEAEYFWVYSRNTFANVSTRALPKSLLACREPGPIRFWMPVGVPMRDPAIRLRVLSQMGSRRFMLGRYGDDDGDGVARRGLPADGAGSREIPGLAVNWRLDDEESMLLSSLGLRVIRQIRAEDFVPHLQHHAWHLGATAVRPEDRAGEDPCPPTPGERARR